MVTCGGWPSPPAAVAWRSSNDLDQDVFWLPLDDVIQYDTTHRMPRCL